MKDTKFTSITDLKLAIAEARDVAEREARRDCGRSFLKSRGAWVIALTDGDAAIGDGQLEFKGTKRQVVELVEEFKQREDVRSIEIAGGFNSAERLEDFAEGVHTPWVSEWSVLLWERAAA